MTSSTQATTAQRGFGPAAHQPARSTRRDDERYGMRAAQAHGAPRWNPDDGDYS